MALRKRSRVWRCRRRKQRRSLSRNDTFFPQQRKLMGSSAQNSSGVHWCRRRVRFNQVPEKVPKVPEKVWEGGGLGSFGAEPGQVQQGSGEGPGEGLGSFGAARSSRRFPEKVWEALVQSQVRLNRQGSREGSGEGLQKLWCKARSSPEWVPGEGLGGFGAEPRQAQQGSGEGSGEGSEEGSRKPWCKAKSGPTGFQRRFRRRSGNALVAARSSRRFPEKVWEALVQSQVRLNRQGSGEGSEEGSRSLGAKPSQVQWVPEKASGGFGAQPGQVQQGFGEGSGEGLGGLGSGEGSGEGVGGFGAEPGQVQQGSAVYSGEGSRKPWCIAKSGSTGSGEGCRSQAR